MHYPGTSLAGVYNRLVSSVHGRQREDEHLVNAPNWLPLDVRTEGGRWWSAGGLTTARERRELDLRRGLLTRTAVLTDPAGRRLRLRQRRLLSMTQPHVAALETTVVPDGWSGTLRVRSGIDAGVLNANVAEYAALANRHLRATRTEQAEPGTLVVEVQTVQSHIHIAVAARTTVNGVAPDAVLEDDDELYSLVLQVRRYTTVNRSPSTRRWRSSPPGTGQSPLPGWGHWASRRPHRPASRTSSGRTRRPGRGCGDASGSSWKPTPDPARHQPADLPPAGVTVRPHRGAGRGRAGPGAARGGL